MCRQLAAGREPGAAIVVSRFLPRADDEAYRSQDEDLPQARGEPVGPGEEPAGAARVRARPARPEAAQALGLREPARGQAEAEALLRQHERAAVPARLRGGDPDA